MTNKPKSNPVPKLRFPEFSNAEGWEEMRLGNEGKFLSSLTGKTGEDFDAGEARFVTYSNVFSNTFVDPKALRFVDVKEGENQNAVAIGDVFFTVSSETPEEVGMSSVLLEEIDNCYLNSFCALFRFFKSKQPNPLFTGYLLRQPLVRSYFTKHAQGFTRFNLSKDVFNNLIVFVPKSAEQQKIAAILTSLDELIEAEGHKLAALKACKTGLIQHLFPCDGETLPRLRFPEFQNAPKWEVKSIGQVVTAIVREKEKPDTPYTGLGIRNHGKGTFLKEFENPAKNSMNVLFEVKPDDLILNITFAWEGSIAIAKECDDGALVSHRFPTYKINSNVSIPGFLRYIIVDKQFVYQLGVISPGGAGRNRVLNKNDFLKIPIVLPKIEEQHRIAYCLTLLDDLIAAQNDKVVVLKIHQKGLMQQLFPAPEDLS